MTDIMIDLETLSLHPEAAVISIAAVQFDRKTGKVGTAFEVGVDLLPQMLNGSKVDQSTLDWWTAQGTDAKHNLVMVDPVDPPTACHVFSTWVTETFEDLNNTNLWG